MKQEKEEWVVGLDEDHFNCDDTYPNQEEAIYENTKRRSI